MGCCACNLSNLLPQVASVVKPPEWFVDLVDLGESGGQLNQKSVSVPPGGADSVVLRDSPQD